MRKLLFTRRGNRIFVLAAVGLLLVLGALSFFGFLRLERIAPPCLFHRVTGLNCPGCGGTRAISAMLRLDFAAAFWYNPLICCLAGVVGGWFLWFCKNAFFGVYHPPFRSRWYLRFCVGAALVTLAFFFLRNTGWYRLLFY